MKIPFWQPSREYFKYKGEIDAAIQNVLSKGELVLGFSPDIDKFESDFAKFVGVKHAIMCGGGTHALLLAYKALGIGPGDEVITVSHTFIATIDQIKLLGATPVLVDIGEDGLMDPKEVEKAITPRTKAIVPVHLEGKVCDMLTIQIIVEKYGLLLIQDAAQAIGANFNGLNVHQLGKVSCFSMFPAKVLGSAGNAGVVVTNDDELARRLRGLRCNFGIGKNQDLDSVEWGMQLEPDNLQAAILNVKLKYLPERLLKRRELAEKYDEAFKDLPIKLPLKQEGRVYQDYVIRVNVLDKPHFVKHLQDNGVGVLGHNLIPNHKYPKLDLDHFNLVKTEEYIAEQLRIPCNPDLTDEEVDYIIKTIREFYKK